MAVTLFARIVDTWDDDGPGPEISFSTFEDYAGSLEYIARELGPAWVWEKNGTSCIKGRRCQEGKRQITSVGLVYTRHVSNINTGYKNPTRYDLRQY